MAQTRKIELLAPARNIECGMAAIDHGADAVYIGASRFGARAAAGNSVDDIARLVDYAHQFRAKVYVTVNTILRDDELEATRQLIEQLYAAKVDALIVQDAALLRMQLPPIPLHASTQMDNRSPEKVQWLADMGYEQVVLARELSLEEIAAIHRATPVPLEAFVHGALCVSYSGQCYASQHCFGRSANRGECAQFCRLAFDMEDAEGRSIVRGKHLLSLKDMNQSESLEQMIDAGVSSFKIEGRLKDVDYVKNVTAHYRQRLDAVISRRTDLERSSVGTTTLQFTPQIDKSFNRGFTDYFLHGRHQGIFSPHTPKSLGEPVGTVKAIGRGWFSVASLKSFSNGDGLCFIDEEGRLQGFRVNKVDGNKLYPHDMPRLQPKTHLYRNYDKAFADLLSRPSAERRVGVTLELSETTQGFSLTASSEDGTSFTLFFEQEKQLARTPQTDNIKRQLSKLGDTIYTATEVTIRFSDQWFIPSSLLAQWRRAVIDGLIRTRALNYPQSVRRTMPSESPFPKPSLTYLGNVSNGEARQFYASHGVSHIDSAFEQQPPKDAVLMFCRHCLRYEMGWCPNRGGERSPFREPYFLTLPDGKRFRLSFDCKQCQMKVYAEE